MTVQNAKITNVTVGFDNRDRLTASISLKGQYDDWDLKMVLSQKDDCQYLLKLMSYTEVNGVEEMKGKIIRIVTFDNILYGFGHPIEDKFVPTTQENPTELTEAEFRKNLKW